MSDRLKLTREALYELVWSQPISKIGPQLRVSDVAVSKICRKLEVPTPPRGYWARVAHGYPVDKPPLPRRKKDIPAQYEIAPRNFRQPVLVKSEVPLPAVPVKDRVTRYHPLVAEVRSAFLRGWTDKYGRIQSHGGVSVSRASTGRALRILDALIRAIEERGVSITTDDDGLRAWVTGESIRLELREPSSRQTPKKQSDYGYPRWEYVPSGRLSLSLSCWHLRGYRTNWADGRSKKLEERLGEVVAVFEEAPKLIAEARESEHRKRLAWERAQLVRRRRSAVYEYTKARAQAVDRLVQNLSKAAEIRELVKAVQKASSPPVATRRLARWAKLYADHLDPLVGYRVPKLDEEAPSTFR